MLNSKGFQLPRAFNLNGLVNTIQGQSLIVKKIEAIKKEGKVAIQTVIAQYGFAQDFSDIRNQVVALITSVNTIREEHPIVNDIYEMKSKKVIFVLGNIFKSEEKAEYILNFRINEELEYQKYVNKPYGIYYIDKTKATEMLNSKGFELPRGFNINGFVNTIQGQSLIVKKYEAIKKEGKVAIQTVIAQYGFAQDFSEIRNQVVALITSVNTIRQSHPMVNDIYEQKSKKVIFVLGNVFESEEKAEYILNCRINEELENQKYRNKPCGIYYIDNKKSH